MKLMKLVPLSLCLIYLFSCTTSQEDLKQEVLDLHDEVMLEMGSIRTTKKSLIEKIENSVDSIQATKLQESITQLDEAHESMMVWMRQFDPEYSGSKEEIDEYLNDQFEEIKKVQEII